MSHTATRSAGVLFVLAPTEFLPSYFSFDQCLQPLTYLMIVAHVIVFISVSKTHSCFYPANDRSRKITRNRRNFDCKAIEDSDCSVSRSSNVDPTTSARVEWSDTSSTVKRNCPGSHIRRRRSTTPTNGDPVVHLGRC